MGKQGRRSMQQVDQGLRTVYGALAPDPAFTQALQRRLVSQVASASKATTSGVMPVKRGGIWPRWAVAVVAVLLVLAAPIAALGPHEVWAAFQTWLGFIPGFGFADLEGVRVLAAPAVVSVDGLEAEVTQAIVGTDTRVVFEISGLPGIEGNKDGVVRLDDIRSLSVQLHLSSGLVLTPTRYLPYYATRHGIAGLAVFPPLPYSIRHLRLTIVADEETSTFDLGPRPIEIPFEVIPADAESVVDRFPLSQQPDVISDPVHDIALSVSQVAYGEHTVSLEMTWENDSPWILNPGWPDYLFDQDNHFSQPSYLPLAENFTRPRDPQGDEGTPSRTYSFWGVSSEAEVLTLTVSSISVVTNSAPLPITFTVDLGDAPVHEQTFPIDVAFSIAGFDYDLHRATLLLADRADKGKYFMLARYPAALLIYYDSQMRVGDLENGLAQMSGIHDACVPGTFAAGETYHYLEGTQESYTALLFDEVPTGVVTVRIESVSYKLRGPWRATWRVPQE